MALAVILSCVVAEPRLKADDEGGAAMDGYNFDLSLLTASSLSDGVTGECGTRPRLVMRWYVDADDRIACCWQVDGQIAPATPRSDVG